MSTLLLAAILTVAEPIPRLPITREPRPAQPWLQTVTLSCGRATYRISGFGAAYPATTPVTITVDRRPIHGAAAAALGRDLAQRGAAYRISGLCARDSDHIELLIYRGLAAPGAPVSFHVGAAWLSPRGEIVYHGMEEADAETFWFR